MRIPRLETEGIYHVYNRGVDKRITFLSDLDYERFIQSMIVFNDIHRTSQTSLQIKKTRPEPSPSPFVKIHSFTLMPNHFHLQIEQCVESGISDFMARLANGYTKYFNNKQKRTGSLFESRFKAKSIQDTSQLQHISRYIHLNPVDLIEPGWQEKGVQNWSKIKSFLINYPWSSLRYYLGIENMSFIEKTTVMNDFDSPDAYLDYIRSRTKGANVER